MFAFLAEGTHTVPPGFDGDNVGAIRQAHPGDTPLHSTDLQILTVLGPTWGTVLGSVESWWLFEQEPLWRCGPR